MAHRTTTPWRDLNHKHNAAKLDQARREIDRAVTLGELRRARDMTQQQLARSLETTQPGVSAIERRTDLYLSTLRSYVEALGGHLEVTAVFADGTVPITTFEALDEKNDDLVPA